MMTVKVSKRVPRGWETLTEQTGDFAHVMAMRDERKRRVEAAKAAGKTLFQATKIGDAVYLSASGTLTELANVGICVACLGRGCGHCDGTGDCRHNAEHQARVLPSPECSGCASSSEGGRE